MNKELLVRFQFDGVYGQIAGLFIATQEQIDSIVGKIVYFGEILGKHSEISLEMELDDFDVLSTDTSTIAMFRHVFNAGAGEKTLIGYNPFDYEVIR